MASLTCLQAASSRSAAEHNILASPSAMVVSYGSSPAHDRQMTSFCASPMLLVSPGLFGYNRGPGQLVHHSSSFKHRSVLAITAGTRRVFNLNPKTTGKENSSDEQLAIGTKFFGFGRRGQASEDQQDGSKDYNNEDAADTTDALPGTQFFRTIGGKVSDWNKTVRGGVQLGLVPISTTASKDLASFKLARRQDPNSVFVAGSTGQIGARIAQKLLRQGFSVRGGVRDLFIAQQLAEFATQYGIISREEAKRLNAVEFDLKSVESIAKAIGTAAKVVITIGPNEDGPKSKVSFEDASNVIEAAKLAKIANLVVVYEPGTGGNVDNPLAGLTSFFSELFSKPVAVSLSEILDQIVDSDLSYTVLTTVSTEGVDDSSPVSQAVDLRKAGSPAAAVSADQSNAKISKGQIASVVAEIITNPDVSENKVVEVFASTAASATATTISELLGSIPVDGRREQLAAARAKVEEEEREREERQKVEAEARAAVEEARRATALAAQLEAEAKKLGAEEARAATLAQKAQAQAAAASASLDGLAARMKELGIPGVTSRSKEASPKAAIKASAADKDTGTNPPLLSKSFNALNSIQLPSFSKPVKVKAAAADDEKPQSQSVSKSQKAKQRPSAAVNERLPASPVTPTTKPQVNSIFGGLFTQETVYIDEV